MTIAEIRKWLRKKSTKKGDKIVIEPGRPSGSSGVYSIRKEVTKL